MTDSAATKWPDCRCDNCRKDSLFAAIEEIISQGGNGEGWYITDAALIARVGQGKGLKPADRKRLRQIIGDDHVEFAPVYEGEFYD